MHDMVPGIKALLRHLDYVQSRTYFTSACDKAKAVVFQSLGHVRGPAC